MVSSIIDLSDFDRRMEGAFSVLEKEFLGLRTGRASVNLLDSVQVEVYGSKMPLTQVGSVAVAEARMLSVQVWDAANAKAVEKAIANAGLGLNPQPSGTLIRIPLPDMTEERRIEVAKVAGKYSESSKVSVRNVRRDAMDQAKADQKDGNLSEDELKVVEGDIQKLTDKWVKKIDEATRSKEEEIKQV